MQEAAEATVERKGEGRTTRQLTLDAPRCALPLLCSTEERTALIRDVLPAPASPTTVSTTVRLLPIEVLAAEWFGGRWRLFCRAAAAGWCAVRKSAAAIHGAGGGGVGRAGSLARS